MPAGGCFGSLFGSFLASLLGSLLDPDLPGFKAIPGLGGVAKTSRNGPSKGPCNGVLLQWSESAVLPCK